MNVDVTVCTLVRGRRDHLANLITGLNRQSVRPSELVIAYMQNTPHQALPETPYAVKSLLVPGQRLPLAAARNRAAMVANGRVLIFLDVDCIPGPDLVHSYVDAVARTGGCVMGETRYLGPGAGEGRWRFDDLWSEGERHPARMSGEDATTLTPITDYGELWGLSFALPKLQYLRVGGFDEKFVGYGAEETDFARSLADGDVPLHFEPRAQAVHQWHEVHQPPLQHFDDIVANARRYRAKRGGWAMNYWLDQFERDGLIRRGKDIEVLRRPTGDEMAAAKGGPEARFS